MQTEFSKAKYVTPLSHICITDLMSILTDKINHTACGCGAVRPFNVIVNVEYVWIGRICLHNDNIQTIILYLLYKQM